MQEDKSTNTAGITEAQTLKPFAIFIALFAGIGGILYGYDIGVISGALVFMKTNLHLNTAELSTIVAAVLGGGAIATLITGPLADSYGRRTMINIAGGVFIVGVLLLIFSDSYTTAMIGRLVQGVGVGIITIIVPLYLTEAAPSSIRGRSVTIFQLFLTAGILLAFVVDLLFVKSGNWRAMFACVLVPAAILFIGSFFLTRSPRWLYSKGLHEEARRALERSHTAKEAEYDMHEMSKLQLNKANISIKSFLKHLSKKQYLLPFLIALSIACLNQLTGINSILQFSTLMLKNSGLSSTAVSMMGSVGVGLINFLTTIVALYLIDKVGRKILLSIGTAGSALALFYSGIICFLPNDTTKGILLIIGLLVFIFAYAIGPGVVVWLALSELLPMSVRSKGMAICLFVNSLVSAILASLFLGIAHHAGFEAVFFLCAVCTLIYFYVAAFLLPETKNQTLEEIEERFIQHEQ
jgi:MFS transporter, SP family, galactose:H+ symporter